MHAALGCDDDLRYLVERLRRVWPDVRICIRGDAGYGMPWMYAAAEQLGVEYLFGIAAVARTAARCAAASVAGCGASASLSAMSSA